MAQVAVEARREYIAGYKIPGKDDTGIVHFEAGKVTQVDKDVLDHLRSKKNSPVAVAFETGKLIELNGHLAQKKYDGIVPMARRDEQPLQVGAEVYTKTKDAEAALAAGI